LRIENGVPQGSILGPIFFLIYINDIDCGKFSNYILFADDIMLFAIHNNYDQMMLELQQDLNQVNKWYLQNKLFVSEQKTVFMQIYTSRKPILNPKEIWLHKANCSKATDCHVNCTKLRTVTETKYLGVTLDHKWKFLAHIETIVSKLRQILPKLYFLRNMLSLSNKKIIYDAWILSHIRYGIEIYGLASETHLKKLQKIQNKIVKILFRQNEDIKVEKIYLDYELLKIIQIRDFVIIIKNYYNTMKLYKDVEQTRTYNTKSIKLRKSLWQNKFGQRSKLFYIPKIFNALPKLLLNICKIGLVKRNIKSWLLFSY
jgi:hypothetical protein